MRSLELERARAGQRGGARAWLRGATLLLGTLSALACRGVQVPEPPEGAQPDDPREARCVDGPPPSARLEELPPPPEAYGERSVWVDGAWLWREGRWTWQPGAWAESQPGAFYVRPRLERLENGALAWFPGHWHTREDEREARAFGRAPLGAAPIVCPAASSSASASSVPSASSASSVSSVPAADGADAGATDAP